MIKKNTYLIFTLFIGAVFTSHLTLAQTTQTDSCAFFKNKSIYPYYYANGISNSKDFYTQKKEFRNTITAKTNFNGIITIYFFINDAGETNFYTMQLCDLNYKTISITNDNKILSNQVLEAVKNTSPWKPMLDENKQPVNCRKFYSFKFNNGNLSEILPK